MIKRKPVVGELRCSTGTVLFLLASFAHAEAPPGNWGLYDTFGSCDGSVETCTGHIPRVKASGSAKLAECIANRPRCWLNYREEYGPGTHLFVGGSVMTQGGSSPDPCYPRRWKNGSGADDPGECAFDEPMGNLGKPTCNWTDQPIDLLSGNGNYSESLIDKAYGMGIALNFNSLTSRWSHTLSPQIVAGPNQLIASTASESTVEQVAMSSSSELHLVRGDGRVIPYQVLVSDPTLARSVVPGNPDLHLDTQGYRFKSDGREYRFASDGKLSSIEAIDGRYAIEKSHFGFSMSRNGVTTVNFYIDSLNRLTKVTYDDHQIVLNYSSSSDRLRTLYVDGRLTKQYKYDSKNPSLLTGIEDARRNPIRHWSYYVDGRVRKAYRPGGTEEYSMAYGTPMDFSVENPVTNQSFVYPGAEPVVITNPAGLQTTLYTIRMGGRVVVVGSDGEESANCAARSRSTVMNDNGQPAVTTDWEGNVTQYQYNDRGLETQRIEAWNTPSQRTIKTEWHPDFNLPVRIETALQIRLMEYNASEQLTETRVIAK